MQEFNTKLFNYDAFRGCSEGVVGMQNTLKDPRKTRTYLALITYLSRTYHALNFACYFVGIIYYVYNTGEIIKKTGNERSGHKKSVAQRLLEKTS